MEPIEEFIKKNKDGFEFLELESDSWEQLQGRMSKEKYFSPSNKRIILLLGMLLILMGIYFYFAESKEIEPSYMVGLEKEMYFPELNLMNPDGESIPVSDLKGKVVLVEFWASYCMVCTEHHCYYFKPLYQDFKEAGFEIYSVSTDSSAVNWVHAIERDELDWIHVSDLMGADSPTVNEFEVQQLPTNYLLNHEGKIIAKNIDVHELEDTLNKLLADNSIN